MGKEDIILWDWPRIMIGEVPLSFFIEAAIRITFIYFLLIASMRLFGKRMAAQLNRNELAALTSLAAAIGVPVQSPDRGLIPSVIIAILVVLIGRLVAWLAARNQKLESITQGKIEPLIKDSILQFEHMKRSRITREKLYSVLRSEGIKHLGEVKRVYIESNGSFTIIKDEKPAPGLSVLPQWDKDFRKQQQLSEEMIACKNCGNTLSRHESHQICANCRDTKWAQAVS
jgi:uncharacterized membrane protein YcaP (DUF421 family)